MTYSSRFVPQRTINHNALDKSTRLTVSPSLSQSDVTMFMKFFGRYFGFVTHSARISGRLPRPPPVRDFHTVYPTLSGAHLTTSPLRA